MRRRFAGLVLGTGVALLVACAPAAAPPAATTAPAPAQSPAPVAASPPASPAVSPAPAASAAASASPSPLAAAAPTSGGPADAVSVGYSNITGDNLSLWYAAETGIFARNQLDVSQVLLAGGSNTTAAVLAGQVQMIDAGGSETLSAVAEGADLEIVAVVSPVYPYVFEVTSDIQSPQDLKGKKVGVATIGGSADIATRVALRSMGLDADQDVTIIATGSAQNRTAALLSGAIQGGMAQGPPDTINLEAQGLHPLVDLASQKLPNANTAVVGQRSWIASHTAVVQRYVDSLVQATAQFHRDKPGTVAILKKYFQTDDDAGMSAAYDFYVGEVLPTLPYPRPEQLKDAVDALSPTRPTILNVDLTHLMDTSFVQSSADRGLDRQ